MTNTSFTNGDKPIEVIFFDVRDTLGEVDRPGHLVPYKPSTKQLLTAMREVVGLRIGVITNLPANLSAEAGRRMIAEAIMSEDDGAKIADYLDPQGIIINHEAGCDKPDPGIYRYAAERMGVSVGRCIFSGENMNEVIGAISAGMMGVLKPSPPGKEFQPAPYKRGPDTQTSSGRAFEQFLEHEHLLGERIFDCGAKIVETLKALRDGEAIPANVQTGMGFLIYLVNNFADQVHLKAEEAVIPLAVARGMDPAHGAWVFHHHDQARAYWQAMNIAWRRLQAGDAIDRPYAINDFWRATEAFVILFRHHAERENDQLYKEIGDVIGDTDDTLILNIIEHTGPSDITPYVAIVGAMEQALGIVN